MPPFTGRKMFKRPMEPSDVLYQALTPAAVLSDLLSGPRDKIPRLPWNLVLFRPLHICLAIDVFTVPNNASVFLQIGG